MNKGLLDGVVVLDLTRVLAGPYSGLMLADMGATVIKLENPKGGDDTRKMGPFVNDNSVYYANFNRSKLGCTLNLKDPDGKEMFKELVKKADIVIENYRPWHHGEAGLGLRRPEGGQSRHHLWRGVRFRPHRPLQQAGGL